MISSILQSVEEKYMEKKDIFNTKVPKALFALFFSVYRTGDTHLNQRATTHCRAVSGVCSHVCGFESCKL